MKLDIPERLSLLELLPKEGDFAALTNIRRAREMISVTPEELKEVGATTEVMSDGSSRILYNPAKVAELIVDIPVDEYITNVIRDKLAELNRTKKLIDKYYSLFDKFIMTYK